MARLQTDQELNALPNWIMEVLILLVVTGCLGIGIKYIKPDQERVADESATAAAIKARAQEHRIAARLAAATPEQRAEWEAATARSRAHGRRVSGSRR